MKCTKCNIRLTEETQTPSQIKKGDRTCKFCNREQSRNWIINNREQQRATQKICHRRRRLIALKTYGAKCSCCGETTIEFLSFQHANGNGKAHRESFIGTGVDSMIKDLRERGWPEEFALDDGTQIKIAILCNNCHYSIDHYGYCPHQEQEGDFNITMQLELNDVRQ